VLEPIHKVGPPKSSQKRLTPASPPRRVAGFLGFDTETKPVFEKTARPRPPATVQLCSEGSCLVAQLTQLKCVPAALYEVLEDRDIIMAGVAVDDDAIELWQYWGLETNCRLELAHVTSGSQPKSLAALTSQILGVRLPKSKTLTLSNWEAPLGERE